MENGKVLSLENERAKRINKSICKIRNVQYISEKYGFSEELAFHILKLVEAANKNPIKQKECDQFLERILFIKWNQCYATAAMLSNAEVKRHTYLLETLIEEGKNDEFMDVVQNPQKKNHYYNALKIPAVWEFIVYDELLDAYERELAN